MLPELIFYLTSFFLNLVVSLFVIYYLFKLRAREKVLEQKEVNIDTTYHHIVDNALAKERQILADATKEADDIIAGATAITQTSKETVEQSLQKMVAAIQKEADTTSRTVTHSYTTSLQKVTTDTLKDFQEITKNLETDLQKQLKDFRETMLPTIEKELEEHKQVRIKQAEQTINKIIKQASQEIFNKSTSLSDHQQLVIEALEKAKKEGTFD